MFRPVWVEVNLNKIKNNLSNIKKLISNKTEVMAVVKANGYGHGSVEVANTAICAGASRLGVALVEEAVPLRKAGIEAPINLLTGPPSGSAEKIADLNLTPTIFNKSHLEELKNIKTKIHIKVDTGMNRIGLKPAELEEFLRITNSYKNIEIEGLFTHFATADNPESALFEKQLQEILSLANQYRDYFHLIHAANSASTLFKPESHLDMVRLGISIYGLQPSKKIKAPVNLEPALSWMAKITNYKRIEPGEFVSYGAKFKADEACYIATIPVGYADGYFRLLSNRTSVINRGIKQPQVGIICMDQFMFKADKETAIGDTVKLISEENGACVSADDLADTLGTINYEIVCAISERVPRRYIKAGTRN